MTVEKCPALLIASGLGAMDRLPQFSLGIAMASYPAAPGSVGHSCHSFSIGLGPLLPLGLMRTASLRLIAFYETKQSWAASMAGGDLGDNSNQTWLVCLDVFKRLVVLGPVIPLYRWRNGLQAP